IPGGWFIDKWGSRVALFCMGLGLALFSALTGLTGIVFTGAMQVWVALLVVRSLMGILSAPLHPASARMVGNWVPPKQQALANGLVTGAALLAYAVVHRMFGALIAHVDWPNIRWT